LGFGFLIVAIFVSTVAESKCDFFEMLSLFSFFSSFILSIIAFVCGVWVLLSTYLHKGTLKGTGRAVDGLLLSLPCILLVLGMYISDACEVYRGAPVEKCGHNLKTLRKAIEVYGKDSGKYPASDKWCDLLMEHAGVTEEQFKCPSDKTGPCSYAINPNAEPNSQPDVVLLFETKGGWNQFGGSERVFFENHKGEGCNVLFNNGDINFITPDEVDELKWKDDTEE
jgi:hypothetical protein